MTDAQPTLLPPLHDVTFRSWSPYVPREMAHGARDRPVSVHGWLALPDGPPPPSGWPAVVVVQGLGGPKPHRELAYGRWLAARGYAALVLDTFDSRKRGGHDWAKALRVTTGMMVADAFAGLDFLAGRPDIDAGRVAVKGYSYGGMVAMMTAFRPIRDLFPPDGVDFAGHVNYYGCSVPRMASPQTTGAPVLIMIGLKDRNVSVPRTEAIAEDMRRGGSDVTMKTFDCYHQWDGNDETRRRDTLHLRHCRITVTESGELRDARTGWALDGPLSRFLFLARYVSPTGYGIQRDEQVLRQSNATLMDFLSRLGPDTRRPDLPPDTAPAPSAGRGATVQSELRR
jgi:dienelactone hydrolase